MVCAVVGCGRPVRSRQWCYRHYMRWWRYGDPEGSPPPRTDARGQRVAPYRDLSGQRIGSLVVLERAPGPGTRWTCRCDCGRTTVVLSSSLMRKDGPTSSCGDRATHRRLEVVKYGPAHERVRADRGDAAAHWCVDCGQPAAHWSYDHGDPDELEGEGGPYSLDVEHYVPRCVSCHKRVDVAAAHGRVLRAPAARPVQPALELEL